MHYCKPYGRDLENHCFQVLLKSFAFNRETYEHIISPENQSETFLEECALRQCFDQQSACEVYLGAMHDYGFSEQRIMGLAQEMIDTNVINDDRVRALFKHLGVNPDSE